MKIGEIALTDSQRIRLQQLLKDKQFPWQIIKRLEVVRLSDKGCTTTMIAKQLGLRPELVRKYRAEFGKSGFEGLIRMEKPGKETRLTEEILKALDAYIKTTKKRYSLKELTGFLQQNYNISISEEWLSKRLAMRKQVLQEAPLR